MPGGGGLARVHVANDHNVDMDLLLAHGIVLVFVGFEPELNAQLADDEVDDYGDRVTGRKRFNCKCISVFIFSIKSLDQFVRNNLPPRASD